MPTLTPEERAADVLATFSFAPGFTASGLQIGAFADAIRAAELQARIEQRDFDADLIWTRLDNSESAQAILNLASDAIRTTPVKGT